MTTPAWAQAVFPRGQLAVATVTFTDPITGALSDPTTITATVRNPLGQITTFTLAGGGVVRVSAGVYYVEIDTTPAVGKWAVRLTTTAVQNAQEAFFWVQSSQ